MSRVPVCVCVWGGGGDKIPLTHFGASSLDYHPWVCVIFKHCFQECEDI